MWVFLVVRPKGFEPSAFSFVVSYSIRLSYGRVSNRFRVRCKLYNTLYPVVKVNCIYFAQIFGILAAVSFSYRLFVKRGIIILYKHKLDQHHIACCAAENAEQVIPPPKMQGGNCRYCNKLRNSKRCIQD